MNRSACAIVLLATIATTGCSSGPHGPYRPQTESRRDTATAQHLTQETARAIAEDDSPDSLERAENMLRRALNADLYHGPAHNNLGVVYLKQGKMYEAASEFEWARKLMPGHPDPRMNLALTLEQAGQIDEALATYSTALEAYPGHMPTIQAMTRLEMYEGRVTPETEIRLGQIALRGDSQRWREWAHDRLGQQR
ncbi:MAG: tetratricopeptide repeat protein [Planctomycetota bacterium]